MENSKKIQEMDILEQNLQGILFQKQAFTMEIDETVSALNELDKSGDEVYKLIGQLMIKTDKSKIKEELSEKNKILHLKMETLEKQEAYLNEKLSKIQEDINPSAKK